MHSHFRQLIVALAVVLSFLAFAHEHERPNPATHNQDHKLVAPHGGIVKAIGEYHAELVFDQKTGKLCLYVLGADAKVSRTITVEKIAADIRIDNDFEPLIFEATPLAGETKITASCFAAAPDYLQRIRRFDIVMTVPIEGKTYRPEFTIDLKGPDKPSRMRHGHPH